MPRYDATEGLDDLFDESGYASDGGAAVATRTRAILDGPSPADSIEAVLRLAERLPRLEDVRAVDENDTSELTDIEQQQKEETEAVIDTALTAGDAALWVVAQGLDRAIKGRWWRRTHSSSDAYVMYKIGRSAVYGRQLRKNAPLALETARQTGTVPKPSQVKVTIRTEEEHGREAAVALYKAVRDISEELGARPTAASLMAAHESLPPQLPEHPEQQRAVIEQSTRRALGLDLSERESNESASIEALNGEGQGEGEKTVSPSTDDTGGGGTGGTDDDIEDAEIVPEHLATLKDALKTLNAVLKAIPRDVFAHAAAEPEDAAEYERVRKAILKKTTALRNRALQAPKG